MSTNRLLVFAGSYAESGDSGVYVYQFNEENGELKLVDQAAGLKNPTFINIDVPNHKLYSISEGVTSSGEKAGEAAAFAIDPETGRLSLLNRTLSGSGTTCHIQRDQEDRFVIVTSYHAGTVSLISLTPDGQLGEVLDVKQHEGRSVHPDRQDRPHPHSTFFSPDHNFLFVQDLGLDRIISYKLDAENGKLVHNGETELHPGAGPRHFVFHPNGAFGYVINEVDSTVSVFTYDAAKGQLTEIQSISTLPDGFTDENSCAEITISKDGKYVYGSNRGHDSIVIYAVDAITGKLTLVEHVSVEGKHPRHFALTPNGDYLIAANRDTNNIVSFRVNKETGSLQFTGKSIEVSKPVCVQPVYM